MIRRLGGQSNRHAFMAVHGYGRPGDSHCDVAPPGLKLLNALNRATLDVEARRIAAATMRRASRIIETVSCRVCDDLALTPVGRDLQLIIEETMRPENVSLWLRPPATAPGQGTTT